MHAHNKCDPPFIQLAVIIPELPNLNTPLSLCHPLQSVDTVCTLYQSFQEGAGSGPGGLMDSAKEPPVRQGGGATGDATLLRPCPKHMSATERLRKVIQELVDTEKSYVKVRLQSFASVMKYLRRSQHEYLIQLVHVLFLLVGNTIVLLYPFLFHPDKKKHHSIF